MSKRLVLIIAVAAAVLIGIFVLGRADQKPAQEEAPATSNEEARNSCMEHGAGISYHVHPNLRILAEGEELEVPANVGVEPGCMKALHTHDASGKIHIEYSRPFDFTLGDFFAVWGQPFSSGQILNYQTDANHRIVMTVNGQPNEEYENLILRDNQQIVIDFRHLGEDH